MGRWGVFIKPEGLQLYSYDDDKTLLTMPFHTDESLELFRQFAKEHNAHEELVSLGQEYENFTVSFDTGHTDKARKRKRKRLERIRSVLAQAKGRE